MIMESIKFKLNGDEVPLTIGVILDADCIGDETIFCEIFGFGDWIWFGNLDFKGVCDTFGDAEGICDTGDFVGDAIGDVFGLIECFGE